MPAHVFGILLLAISAFCSYGIGVDMTAESSQGVVRRASALARSAADDSDEAPREKRRKKSSPKKKKKSSSEDEDGDASESDDDDEEPTKPTKPTKPAAKPIKKAAKPTKRPAKSSSAEDADDDEQPASSSLHSASKPPKKKSSSLRSSKSNKQAKSSEESSSSGGTGSLLEKSGVATKITSLGNDVQKVVSDTLDLVKKIGIDCAEPVPFENEKKGKMKARVSRAEESLSSAHKAISSMERQMLGSAGTWDSSGKAAKGLKKKISALEVNVKGMKGRMTALKKSTSSVTEQIDELEQSVEKLSQKAAGIFQSLDSSPPEQPPQANPDASFTDRLNAIENYGETMEKTVADLETEVLGSETRSPPKSKVHGFSDKAKNLEVQFKNLKSRLTSLEQEV